MEGTPFSLSPDQLKGLQKDPARKLVEPLQMARRRDPTLPRYLREYEKPLHTTQIPTGEGTTEALARLVLSIQDVGMFNPEKLERIKLGVRFEENAGALGEIDMFHLRRDERFQGLFENLEMEQNGDIPKKTLRAGGYEQLASILREMESRGYWDELITGATSELNAWLSRARRLAEKDQL